MNVNLNRRYHRRLFLTTLLGLIPAARVAAPPRFFIDQATVGGTNILRVTLIMPSGTMWYPEKSTDPNETNSWSPLMPANYIARRDLADNTVQWDIPIVAITKAFFVRASDAMNINLPAGSSVYDGMDYLGVHSDFSMSATRFAGMGFFIDSIGGIRNQGGRYWRLYINGNYSKVGASSYEVNTGDRIYWKYE